MSTVHLFENRAARRARDRHRPKAARAATAVAVLTAALAAGLAVAPAALAEPGQGGVSAGQYQGGVSGGHRQDGTTVPAPTSEPAPVPEPDPAPVTAGPKAESDFWIAPPAEYNRGTQPYRGGDPRPGDDSSYSGGGDDDYSVYADGGDHYSGDAGGGDYAGGGDTAPVTFGELHAPVPVTATLPIEAPRETIRLGRVLIAQPNWVSGRDVARTNNTTAVVEAQVTDVWRSVGLETGEAERIASAQIAGGVVGAAAGALAGGTLGGLSGAALGELVPTPIPGVPVVTTGVAGTAVGAGIGAAALGVPAAAVGAVGGGLAGVAAGTAYGAGEGASQLEVAVPDVEHEQIVAGTTTQVERWAADPAAAAAVETVRTVVTDTAPALDTQARAAVTAQPGGAQVVEQVDRVLTGVFTDTTPGRAAQLLATAVGDGLTRPGA